VSRSGEAAPYSRLGRILAAGDPDGDSYSRLNRMLEEGKGARGGEAEGEGREVEALEVLEMGRG
jgi:hypothetical protein